ncbi:MAG: hypothetical protein ACTSYD_02630 [Candidatus Heimdallarchaeaceae archaeon]
MKRNKKSTIRNSRIIIVASFIIISFIAIYSVCFIVQDTISGTTDDNTKFLDNNRENEIDNSPPENLNDTNTSIFNNKKLVILIDNTLYDINIDKSFFVKQCKALCKDKNKLFKEVNWGGMYGYFNLDNNTFVDVFLQSGHACAYGSLDSPYPPCERVFQFKDFDPNFLRWSVKSNKFMNLIYPKRCTCYTLKKEYYKIGTEEIIRTRIASISEYNFINIFKVKETEVNKNG